MPASIGDVTTTPARADDGPRESIDPLRLLTAIGSPIALATALALYFGWVRSSAQAAAFGADVSVFDMSPQDLVLRSVDVVFLPICVALLIGLGLVALEPWLRNHAEPVGRLLRFSWILVPLGLVLLLVDPAVGGNLLPLFLMGGIAGTGYGNLLRRRARGDFRPPRLANVALVGALLIATLFWQTERLARVGGQALADDLKQNLPDRLPRVTLLSGRRLAIDGPKVVETPLGEPDGAYRYRYDGLYLLQRSGDKYFLLTDGWPRDGRLLILLESDEMRLEFGGRR
jgi:hypothetical protein